MPLRQRLSHKEESSNFGSMYQLYGVTLAHSCNQPESPLDSWLACTLRPMLSQAARLFGKAPPKFHTLEYGAQALEEPQIDVPKELQEGPAPLEEPTSSRAQEHELPEAANNQAEIQAGPEVGVQPLHDGLGWGASVLLPWHVLRCTVLCCAVLCCAVLCCAVLCCAGHHHDFPGTCCVELCCAMLP